MARYQMEDGTVVDTEKATKSWDEQRDWDGNNHIGRSCRSQWHDQSLYRSRKGRYYIEHCSRVSGETDWAEWISPERAAAWLELNEFTIPDDLTEAAEKMTE
jgi:hypothetical protein